MSAPLCLWSSCLFSFFFLLSPPSATAGHLSVGTAHTFLRFLTHTQIYTRRRTYIPTHTNPVLTLCLTKVRFYQHRLLSVLLLSLSSTSWDIPSIEQLYQNPDNHARLRGAGFLPRVSLPDGSAQTSLPAGARAPWGRTQSRGPRVSCLTMQLWDIFQNRATTHTCSSPTQGHGYPTAPPAADVMSLLPAALAEKQSPRHLYLHLLMMLKGRLSISSL